MGNKEPTNKNKVIVTEMMMLCWMCGKTRWIRFRNGDIRERERERVGVTHIIKKIIETISMYVGGGSAQGLSPTSNFSIFF